MSVSPSMISPVEYLDQTGYDVAGYAAQALQDWRSLAATLDHALLHPAATSNDVIRLCEEASRYRFACVAVNPCWTALAHSALAGTGIAVGAVIGFPFGASLTRAKREEADSVLRLGARELDMVMNIGALKSGDYATVRGDVHALVELAHDAGAILKIVLETCLLTMEEKLRACEICIAAGVDFVGTSTGFSTEGATAEDVSLLRGVAGGRCGVLASGGIESLHAVRAMLETGASRVATCCGALIMQSYGAPTM